MKRIFYDVTVTMEPGMVVYPGEQPFRVSDGMSISGGDVCNTSELCFGSHTGTHIDAPKHFIDNGLCVYELGLEHFIGRAKVFELMNRDAVTGKDLEGLDIRKGDIVLFKTGNSALLKEKSFQPGFTYITASAAKYLVDAGIRTLGFDYLTVEKTTSNNNFEVHRLLLGGNVVIIEGLDLYDVPPGEYEIMALPLKIRDGNGSPARVILAV